VPSSLTTSTHPADSVLTRSNVWEAVGAYGILYGLGPTSGDPDATRPEREDGNRMKYSRRNDVAYSREPKR